MFYVNCKMFKLNLPPPRKLCICLSLLACLSVRSIVLSRIFTKNLWLKFQYILGVAGFGTGNNRPEFRADLDPNTDLEFFSSSPM